jgi:hypothetical protein
VASDFVRKYNAYTEWWDFSDIFLNQRELGNNGGTILVFVLGKWCHTDIHKYLGLLYRNRRSEDVYIGRRMGCHGYVFGYERRRQRCGHVA